MTSATWRPSSRLPRTGSSSSPRGPARGGFTLLELLFALGLIGLTLGMALPRIDAVRSAYFSDEAGAGLVNTVRAARLAAVGGRTTVALTLAEDGGDFLAERRLPAHSWDEAESFGPPTRGEDWRQVWDAPVVRRHGLPGRLELLTPERGIAFFANGTCSGGRITIKADGEDQVRSFVIDPASCGLFAQ